MLAYGLRLLPSSRSDSYCFVYEEAALWSLSFIATRKLALSVMCLQGKQTGIKCVAFAAQVTRAILGSVKPGCAKHVLATETSRQYPTPPIDRAR